MGARFLVIGIASFVFGLSSASAAAIPSIAETPQTCFRDVREFEAVRDRLPAVIRTGAVYATHKSFTMRGGFRVFQAGSRFVIEAKGKTLLGQKLNEDQNIKLACFQTPVFKVWLDDGRYDEMTLEPGGFRFHGFLFKLTTAEGYLRVTGR